jgi:hypothetical protein
MQTPSRLLIPLYFFAALEASAQPARTVGVVERSVKINVMDLARAPRAAQPPAARRIIRPRPKRRTEPADLGGPARLAFAPPLASQPSTASIIASFPAELDNGTATPPDATGALGPQHVVTALNQQVQFQTRTGDVISAVDLETFWAAAGPIDEFTTDPHVFYDTSSDRWLACALADPDRPSTAALLLGASAGGDPTADWSLYRVPLNLAGRLAGDYPLLGFNGSWVVLTLDIFRGTSFDRSNIYLFAKSDLYSGANDTPAFTMYSDPNFTFLPVQDFDGVPDRLFFVQNDLGRRATLRVSEIQGPIGSETFLSGRGTVVLPSPWADQPPASNGDFAPQLGTAATIDAGDSRMLSCVLRNRSIWCSHTVFLPVIQPSRSAAQWVEFDPNRYQVQQFGRIDDPAGVNFYAYPAISVNKNGDALIGYSRFSADQYPSANFSFRGAGDPPNTLEADTVIKDGESFYRVPGRAGQDNRWGDFSTTLVDPADDLTFWTIQEYGASPAADNSPRWGTWWASIAPPQ